MAKDASAVAAKIRAVQDVFYVIGGKWKLAILISLHHGNKRFKEIQNSIPKITSRVLSKELKELEANMLVKRTVYDDFPVLIEYTLTDYMQTMQPMLDEIKKWGELHRKKITKKLK